MDPRQIRENHLLSVVSALGGFEETLKGETVQRIYVPGDEAVGTPSLARAFT